MTPEHWQQVKEILNAALGRDPHERAAFISKACGGDESLRHEVESLIISHGEAGSFIEEPAFHVNAELLADEQTESLAGRSFGPYEILSKLGAGGMGDVYLAQDSRLGRKVALKLLPSQFTSDADRLHRFQQEARAASALNHPNILTIHEIGEIDGQPFIATEFIDGQTLREHTAKAVIKLEEALDVAVQVASALAAAHAAGIVHRDIKPENIMIRHDGFVKVLDFGLVKLTEKRATDSEAATLVNTDAGVVMGTAHYMSPEQARGKKVDARTDIWSLGVVIYEMVTGHKPFEGGTPSDVLSLILQREPAPLARYSPEVPTELDRIIRRALHKDREERYHTVKDFLIDLKNLRRELQFKAELERSAAPNGSDAAVAALSSGQAVAGTEKQPEVQTSLADAAHPTSSAEYIVTEIKRHKRGAVITLAVLSLVAAVTVFWYFKHTRAAPLTEKDTILLADFVNTTGDAAFDGTLKQALAMQLEQSPFLNIFSDEGVRETLRLMGRTPDERVTKEVAREICERQGLKAYFAGSISNLGSHLVITLEAVNAQTGDTLARQQVEAESKEQVLSTLGQAATKLREKLGESLVSIQKYDAPIAQATTSSLEALKAFSLGREQHGKGNFSEAILLFKRAIELDPNFALAYGNMSWSYSNSGQRQLASEAAQKAFELRERTSELEKLRIASDYYTLVTGEDEKAIEALELLKRTYPRDFSAHNNLAFRFNAVGRYEQAIEEAREAISINPNVWNGYYHLATAFRNLNRFDEAKEIYEQALAQKVDYGGYHPSLYSIAFVRGDTAAIQQQLDWARGKPDERGALWQANTAAYLGQLRRARELDQRVVDAQLSRNLKEAAAVTISANALRATVTGNCQQAREDIARASALPRTNLLETGVQGNVSSFFGIGTALALCGEPGQAQSLADEYAKQYPKDTLVNAVWLPAIRAAIEIRRNNPAQAIQFLQSAKRYDRTGVYWPEYLRGQAYLAQHAGAEAAAEFQKILDRRGLAPTSVLYPLAHLGLARAAALQGDTTKARKSYQDFFALWKDADPDIPILIEAKKEYEKLK